MSHIRTVSARQREIRAYFSETTARAEFDRPSPVFAGRDGAIRPILRDAERLSRAQGPKANLSTVLYGAPGSGKSELLAQLRARLTAMHLSDSPIAVVSGGAALLTDAGALGAAVYEALGSESRKNLRDRFGWNIAGLSLGPVGLSLDRKDDRPPGVEENRLRKVAADINESARNPTVVLMIDEAQGELREAAGASDNFVLAMHKGEAHLKLLPIYAGLGDTPRLLADCHVSRLGYGKDHLMRQLEANDVAAMTEEALAALAGRNPHRWVDAIVEHTQGWPMHLANVLSAVAERATPEWTIDDNVFRDAMWGAGQRRTAYYETRLGSCPDLHPTKYVAWARLFQADHPVHDRAVASALDVSHEDARALTGRAVRAGLVEETRSGIYESPIPSLLDHIERRGRELDAVDRGADRTATRG